MTEPTRDAIELTRRQVDGEEVYEYRGRSATAVTSRLQFWIVTAVGAALGVALFLALAAMFFYVVVPLLAITALVVLVRRLLSGTAVRR